MEATNTISHPQTFDQPFDQFGFVAIPGFLEPTQVTELELHVQRFIQTILPSLPAEHIFFEDKADATSLKQIQKMGDYDAYFHDLLNGGAIRQLAESLLNDAVVPQNLQYFNKPPQISQATPAHQDGYYFMLEPCEAVTFWLALDVTDEANGCVRYVPESHRMGMRSHRRTSTLGFSQGIDDYSDADRSTEVAIHANPGDMLAHHAMTIHRADANRSANRQRRALGFIYYAERAKHDQQAHQRYQLQLAKELSETGKI